MSELVTDEMVEEALEGSYDPPKEPGYTFLNRDAYRDLWSHHMRAALEAVAPAIAAKAWEEGFDTGTTHGIAYQAGNNDALARPDNPYSADRMARCLRQPHRAR